MLNYDKTEIKSLLEEDQIFDLLIEFQGNPEYRDNCIVSDTICHNEPNKGSPKLYYYYDSKLFHCYSGCAEASFDIFELVRKVAHLQWHQELDLNEAVRWIAFRFGFSGSSVEIKENSQDWEYFETHEKLEEKRKVDYNGKIELPTYDDGILKCFNYSLRIAPWLREGISQEVIEKAHIGFFPGEDQITIPHYDADGNFVGLRGRTVVQEMAERYGKYRPMKITNQLYNHPLGINLYGLNWCKDNIKAFGKVVVVEGEKSVLKYMSYFGIENNICVAVCGSTLSDVQVDLLRKAGAKEIIIAFDKQFEKLYSDEYSQWQTKIKKLCLKYKNLVSMSIIWDRNNLLDYKDSPLDKTPEVFMKLFQERIII